MLSYPHYYARKSQPPPGKKFQHWNWQKLFLVLNSWYRIPSVFFSFLWWLALNTKNRQFYVFQKCCREKNICTQLTLNLNLSHNFKTKMTIVAVNRRFFKPIQTFCFPWMFPTRTLLRVILHYLWWENNTKSWDLVFNMVDTRCYWYFYTKGRHQKHSEGGPLYFLGGGGLRHTSFSYRHFLQS